MAEETQSEMQSPMTWPIGETTIPPTHPRAALHDSLFLATVIVLSCLPYTRGLGLYSDDWGFLASMHAADGSYRSVLASLMIAMQARPVQGIVIAGLYWLFGLNIFAYHVVNCAVLAATVLLFHHSLRALRVARPIALVIPLVFGLLPHYSTDRFWIAAFQANVCVLLYFVSLYADIRFVGRSGRRGWLWKALGTAALVGSVLAYEVTAALFLVNVIVLLYLTRVVRHGAWAREAMPTVLAVASNILALALAVGYKLTTTERADVAGGYLLRALRIVREGVPVHFGEYGLALPVRVGQVLRDYPDPLAIGVSLLIGAIAGAYLLLAVRQPGVSLERGRGWSLVILVGGILFVAGYGVSLTTWEIGFHMTGPNNRTANGAAIGVAWVFVGVIGWIGTLPSSERARWLTFASLVALLSASGSLVTSAVAGFWEAAARQQQVHIAAIRQQLPTLPPGATLLLDGICPFVGPAPVLATDWDMTGMLRLAYPDQSLSGDVVKPNTQVTGEGVRTQLFDDWVNVHPYGERLMVFHAVTGDVVTLDGEDAARRYFADISVPSRPACPPYTDGDGVEVF